MQKQQDQQQLAFAKELVNEIEKNSGFERIETFFTREEKLINHLFRSEKEEAQQDIKLIIDCLISPKEGQSLDIVKYYLITLSSLIARHFEKSFRVPDKAYAFNIACFQLIDSKLNRSNSFEIADELIEFYIHMIIEKKKPALLHNTVNNVILYMNERVKSAVTVEGIAKHFDVSTSHLSRIFREHVGITLVEYINIRKVEESQYALRFSDKKIADISDQFYFCNQSYFTRIFKKYTGQTPKRFRSGSPGEYYRFMLPGEEKQS